MATIVENLTTHARTEVSSSYAVWGFDGTTAFVLPEQPDAGSMGMTIVDHGPSFGKNGDFLQPGTDFVWDPADGFAVQPGSGTWTTDRTSGTVNIVGMECGGEATVLFGATPVLRVDNASSPVESQAYLPMTVLHPV